MALESKAERLYSPRLSKAYSLGEVCTLFSTGSVILTLRSKYYIRFMSRYANRLCPPVNAVFQKWFALQ